ncbi:hypothetical protein Tdes44962_MAKER03131 [Teratosphaeria destructans]|uniref:Uncharacterized protein n=1 Tax=Teratosphaeria destructans TaxID=418781 RepID=A0A9W7SQZ8_9PEZI|nr:hypothetical protein Tdes44962_MAKER03131 [Teratosphaeria destructans]
MEEQDSKRVSYSCPGCMASEGREKMFFELLSSPLVLISLEELPDDGITLGVLALFCAQMVETRKGDFASL